MDVNQDAGALIGTSGDPCRASGAYRCDSCGVETVPVAKGEKFPPCARERKAVNWALIRAV